MHLNAFHAGFLCTAGLSVAPAAHHSHGNYDVTAWTVMEGAVGVEIEWD